MISLMKTQITLIILKIIENILESKFPYNLHMLKFSFYAELMEMISVFLSDLA